MRWLISLSATGILATAPMLAHGSTECTNLLLEAPLNAVSRQLLLSSGQASQLLTVREEAHQREALLRARLKQAQIASYKDAWNGHRAERLEQQLEYQAAVAASNAIGVLTPWQHSRCVGVFLPPPPRPRRAPVVVIRHQPKRKVVWKAPRTTRRRAVQYKPPVVHRAPPVVKPKPRPDRTPKAAPVAKLTHRAPGKKGR